MYICIFHKDEISGRPKTLNIKSNFEKVRKCPASRVRIPVSGVDQSHKVIYCNYDLKNIRQCPRFNQ